MKQNVATLLGLELSAVTFTFLDAPPSTMLTVQVNTASQLAASTARTTLAGQFNSAAAAANLLFGADSSLVEAVPAHRSPLPSNSAAVCRSRDGSRKD